MATNAGADPWTGYDNPFRQAKISPSRVDMGYDAVGRGNIFAIGPGIITEADHAWSGALGAPYPGTFIVEKITDGPLRGRSIYYAEDINIARGIKPGTRVDSNTIIGSFTGAGSGEFGYAYGTGGETLAAHFGQDAAGRAHSGDPGEFSTAYGVAFANVAEALGAPHDTINPPIQGQVGSRFPTGGDIGGGGAGGIQTTSFFGDLLGGLLGTNPADMLERVGLVIFGALLILVGVWMLVGKQTFRVAVKGAEASAL